MSKGKPRQLTGAMPARSVRVGDDVWLKAKKRAEFDGVTISHVIYVLLEGYAKGYLNLPQVEVRYSQPRMPDRETA